MFQQCPVDYTKGTSPNDNTCYRVMDKDERHQKDATAMCQNEGGWLAYPRSTAEYDFIFSLAIAAKIWHLKFWLGGEKIDGV